MLFCLALFIFCVICIQAPGLEQIRVLTVCAPLQELFEFLRVDCPCLLYVELLQESCHGRLVEVDANLCEAITKLAKVERADPLHYMGGGRNISPSASPQGTYTYTCTYIYIYM